MGSLDPLLAIGGSQACNPAAGTKDGVCKRQEDAPAVNWLDTRGATLMFQVALAHRGRLLLCLCAAPERFLLLVANMRSIMHNR